MRRKAGGKGRESFDVLLKLLLLGDSGVGKSSLLTQYVEDDFHDVFISTIGIDFRNKTLEIDGKRIKLRIWDTAGQERFRTLTAQFYRGSQGILMVFDMTNRESFDNIDHWMRQIKQNTDTDPTVVLVANKCDMADQRVVKRKEGEKLAKRFKCSYFEASAKTDESVKEAFHELAVEVVRNYYRKKLAGDAKGQARGAGAAGGAGADNSAPAAATAEKIDIGSSGDAAATKKKGGCC